MRARRVLAVAAATKISSRLKWFFLRPQNADGERARTERRDERRRSSPPLLALPSGPDQDTEESEEVEEARFPARARAGIGR